MRGACELESFEFLFISTTFAYAGSAVRSKLCVGDFRQVSDVSWVNCLKRWTKRTTGYCINKEKQAYACRLGYSGASSYPSAHFTLTNLPSFLRRFLTQTRLQISISGSVPKIQMSSYFPLVSILAAIVGGYEVVQFSYFSAREYLTSNRIANPAPVSHFRVVSKSAHTLLAEACLSIMSHQIGRAHV